MVFRRAFVRKTCLPPSCTLGVEKMTKNGSGRACTRGDRGRPIFGVPGSIFGVRGSIFGSRVEKSRNFGCSKKSVFLRGVGVPLTFEFSKIGSPSPMGGRPGVIFGVRGPSGGRPPRGSLRGGPGLDFGVGGPDLGSDPRTGPGAGFSAGAREREIGWSAGEGWADSSRVLKTFFSLG